MYKFNYFCVLFSILFISCSEGEDVLPPIEFIGSEVSKTMTFIEDPISLTVQGSGFSAVNIVSNKSNTITINELSKNVFEISANKAVKAKI